MTDFPPLPLRPPWRVIGQRIPGACLVWRNARQQIRPCVASPLHSTCGCCPVARHVRPDATHLDRFGRKLT